MRRVTSLIAIAAVLSVGCALSFPATASPADQANQNSVICNRHAHPFGVDMATWGEQVAQWIYGQPAAHNAILDQTGADCANNQSGPVWFIPPIAGPQIENSTRSCTIPAHKAILLDIGEDVNDYPCPDPTFRPEPGESLYDFLIRTDKPIMDSVDELDVTLDGRSFADVLSYRYISDGLFTLTGDLTMQTRWDPCITGSPQPAIIDGFFMMFKPLSAGQHTLVVHGTNTFGDDKTYTYLLTVE